MSLLLSLFLQALIIKHTVAVALEVWIFDLLLKFSAHAFIILGLLSAARTVSAALLQTRLNHTYDPLVGIECDFHFVTSFFLAC